MGKRAIERHYSSDKRERRPRSAMPSNKSRKPLELLRARYADSLANKRQALARARDAFEADPADPLPHRELTMQLHRLAGSAAAYGYEHLGACARVAVDLLRDPRASLADPRAAVVRHDLAAPAIQAVLDELDRANASVGKRTALHIVLVEDDPAQAELTGAELETNGCVIRLASDAVTLRKILTAWSCEAVVLDYWLRGESADEIALTLRREPRFASIALVCYSQERDPYILHSALAAGCDAAIGKDEGPARLLAVVRACVARPDRSGATFG